LSENVVLWKIFGSKRELCNLYSSPVLLAKLNEARCDVQAYNANRDTRNASKILVGIIREETTSKTSAQFEG
jgi:hypothetical protein